MSDSTNNTDAPKRNDLSPVPAIKPFGLVDTDRINYTHDYQGTVVTRNKDKKDQVKITCTVRLVYNGVPVKHVLDASSMSGGFIVKAQALMRNTWTDEDLLAVNGKTVAFDIDVLCRKAFATRLPKADDIGKWAAFVAKQVQAGQLA